MEDEAYMYLYRYVYQQGALIGSINWKSRASFMPYFTAEISLEKYKVLKETKKGYWIEYYRFIYRENNYKKWVPKEGKKLFAFATKTEAMKNFLIRTKKRQKYLERDLAVCKSAIEKAEKMKIEEETPVSLSLFLNMN